MVAVVAEHEVVAGWDDQFPALGALLQKLPPARFDARVAVNLGGKVVEIGIGGGGLEGGVGLVEELTIDENTTVVDTDAIAGQADEALDQILPGVERGVEGVDFAALDAVLGENLEPEGGWGEGGAVHEEEVADQQGVFHAFGWDNHWLGEEGQEKEGDDYGSEQ